MSLFPLILRLYRAYCHARGVTVPFHQLGDDARRPWYQLARRTLRSNRRRYAIHL